MIELSKHLPILLIVVPLTAAPICVLLGNRKLVYGFSLLVSWVVFAISVACLATGDIGDGIKGSTDVEATAVWGGLNVSNFRDSIGSANNGAERVDEHAGVEVVGKECSLIDDRSVTTDLDLREVASDDDKVADLFDRPHLAIESDGDIVARLVGNDRACYRGKDRCGTRQNYS